MGIAWRVALPLVALLPLVSQDVKQDSGQCVAPASSVTPSVAFETEPGKKNGPPIPSHVDLNLARFQMLGSKNAPLTVVEFTDYQCPFCQGFHRTVYRELKKSYIDTGKVRFFSRDLPMGEIHPDAVLAALAARCAADQSQFWPFRELLGANPDKLDFESLAAAAAELKMDVGAFRYCLASEKYREALWDDVLAAEKMGIDGTPAFVVGRTTPTGVDGEVLVGAQPLSEFVKAFAKVKGVK